MTYDTREKSVASGAPIEYYKFTSDFGNFYYTDHNETVVVGDDIYEPLNISRNNIETGSSLDSISTVDITLPVDTQLAALYCFLQSPQLLTVQIWRFHAGDDPETQSKSRWIGTAVGSSVDGNLATIKTGSLLQAALSGNTGNIIYQRSCNHVLYDARCKVDKASFTIAATVTKVRGAKIEVNNDGAADHELQGGKFVVVRNGEERGIFDNVNNTLSVGFAFIDIEIGDNIQLIHGCDHARLGDCKTKFNNVANYGGFDFIPTVNPFTDMNNQAIITTRTDNQLKMILRTFSANIESN